MRINQAENDCGVALDLSACTDEKFGLQNDFQCDALPEILIDFDPAFAVIIDGRSLSVVNDCDSFASAQTDWIVSSQVIVPVNNVPFDLIESALVAGGNSGLIGPVRVIDELTFDPEAAASFVDCDFRCCQTMDFQVVGPNTSSASLDDGVYTMECVVRIDWLNGLPEVPFGVGNSAYVVRIGDSRIDIGYEDGVFFVDEKLTGETECKTEDGFEDILFCPRRRDLAPNFTYFAKFTERVQLGDIIEVDAGINFGVDQLFGFPLSTLCSDPLYDDSATFPNYGFNTLVEGGQNDIATSAINIDVQFVNRVLIGDLNEDKLINLADISGFVDALLGSYNCRADIDQDCDVDLLDLTPFVDLIINN